MLDAYFTKHLVPLQFKLHWMFFIWAIKPNSFLFHSTVMIKSDKWKEMSCVKMLGTLFYLFYCHSSDYPGFFWAIKHLGQLLQQLSHELSFIINLSTLKAFSWKLKLRVEKIDNVGTKTSFFFNLLKTWVLLWI